MAFQSNLFHAGRYSDLVRHSVGGANHEEARTTKLPGNASVCEPALGDRGMSNPFPAGLVRF